MTEKKTNSNGAGVKRKPAPKPYTPQYGVIILCDDERHQEKIYNLLKKEGHKCRIVTT
jgi:hypothetical protein